MTRPITDTMLIELYTDLHAKGLGLLQVMDRPSATKWTDAANKARKRGIPLPKLKNQQRRDDVRRAAAAVYRIVAETGRSLDEVCAEHGLTKGQARNAIRRMREAGAEVVRIRSAVSAPKGHSVAVMVPERAPVVVSAPVEIEPDLHALRPATWAVECLGLPMPVARAFGGRVLSESSWRRIAGVAA